MSFNRTSGFTKTQTSLFLPYLNSEKSFPAPQPPQHARGCLPPRLPRSRNASATGKLQNVWLRSSSEHKPVRKGAGRNGACQGTATAAGATELPSPAKLQHRRLNCSRQQDSANSRSKSHRAAAAAGSGALCPCGVRDPEPGSFPATGAPLSTARGASPPKTLLPEEREPLSGLMRGPMSPCPSEEGSGLGRVQCRSCSPDGGHLSAGLADGLQNDNERRELSALFRRETAREGSSRGNAGKGRFLHKLEGR